MRVDVETASTKLAGWTYDNAIISSNSKPAIGYPVSTTNYNGGDTYPQTINSYNFLGRIAQTTTKLTGQDAALVRSTGFIDQDTYTQTGYGLPHEDIKTAYNDVTGATDFGEPVAHEPTG